MHVLTSHVPYLGYVSSHKICFLHLLVDEFTLQQMHVFTGHAPYLGYVSSYKISFLRLVIEEFTLNKCMCSQAMFSILDMCPTIKFPSYIL